MNARGLGTGPLLTGALLGCLVRGKLASFFLLGPPRACQDLVGKAYICDPLVAYNLARLLSRVSTRILPIFHFVGTLEIQEIDQ